ncbi:hypothetical protein RSOL_218970 [Rhizoctonia solani AG-3 Rhs1AP]|uniref:F-box domain-containing protein n=3 Tax=Rhizoctonia solani AG-3 TaxID=1086053 RepID=A0A074REM1_9AGAM|nr:hypothetical protein RSOL_218970 [Rhizoctonia solani AG-3 Rhs1AP]KEP45224.1 hypothetical protein V565_300370 [Rhizoctonia solani 123E]
MPNLSDLPADVYAVILSHVPPPERQRAVLNLSRALPRSPVPTSQIYNHIIVYTPTAVFDLYKHFRRRKDHEAELYNPSELVKSISVRAWVVDADLVVNLLALLPSVPVMQMCIGTTYSPEHLHDIFARPRLALRTLQLRFKPYVEKAIYMPFLKGVYFDSTIIQLAQWPATEDKHLNNLSITQDTISYSAHIKFAQPLAFFSFKPLTDLAVSPIGQHLRALRISVPAKPVITHIGSISNSFPQLNLLDISTTSLPPPNAERAIGTLLSWLIRLRHVIIDRNAGPMPRDSFGWSSLGRACALAGVERAKEKEQQIQEWADRKRQEEAAARGDEEAPTPAPLAPAHAPRARRGRRGLAAATVSLRDSRPAPNTPTSSSPATRDPTIRRIRVVPSPPTLETFSTAYAGPSNPSVQQRSDWSQAFVKGFRDGCNTLGKIWQRMQDSATVRVMRFTETDTEPFLDDDDAPAVFRGVADIAIDGHWIGWEPTVPVICFGSERAAIGLNKHADDSQPLIDPLNKIRIGDYGPTLSSGIAGHGETPSTMNAASGAIANDPPSSVGGLWEEEDFIEWGPGHADGCGHDLRRRIFD